MNLQNIKRRIINRLVTESEIRWLVEQAEKTTGYLKDIEELDESLHIARVHNRDLHILVKSLKDEIERLEKQLENAGFTDTDIKPKPHRTFELE